MKTKEDALRAIAEAEVKIAEAKAILKQEEEIVLEYENRCYYIGAYQITAGLGDTPEALEHARYRDTKEQAKQALWREKEANRLEAHVMKKSGLVILDWENEYQEKWSISYSYNNNRYEMWKSRNSREIGVIYMSKSTAEQLVEELNSGRYKL